MIRLAHPSPQPKRYLDRFSRFAQMTAECSYSLQCDALRPSKLPLPMEIWTASNTWFPGPTRVLNPNGISIGSAVFAGLTSVTDRQTDLLQTDRQTDRPRYSVGNSRSHLRMRILRATRPKNTNKIDYWQWQITPVIAIMHSSLIGWSVSTHEYFEHHWRRKRLKSWRVR